MFEERMRIADALESVAARLPEDCVLMHEMAEGPRAWQGDSADDLRACPATSSVTRRSTLVVMGCPVCPREADDAHEERPPP